MNKNYYPIDFQAQYEETSEKILELTRNYREKIIKMQPKNDEDLQNSINVIQDEIQDKQLLFRKQTIYSQFATLQQLAEGRKNIPEMCPECGEQLKKQIQCQFCAQVYCKSCCWRKRVIPFVSKQFRLSCEVCHRKFVKLFHNKDFYEQKQKLMNVINFVKSKTLKINEKLEQKQKQYDEYKNSKRNQKMKENNLEKKIKEEQKKVKLLEDEIRRIIAQKAEKMKQEERRRRLEEQQRQKAKEAELRRLAEQQEQREKIQRQQYEQSKRHINNETQTKRQQIITPKQSMDKPESEKLIKTADSKNISQSKSRRQSEQMKQAQIKSNISHNEHNIHLQKLISVSSNGSSNVSNLKQKEHEKIHNNIKLEVTKKDDNINDSLERSLANMFKPGKKDNDDAKSIHSNMSKTSKSALDMSVNELLGFKIPVSPTKVPSKVQQPNIMNESQKKEKKNQTQIDIKIKQQQVSTVPHRKNLERRISKIEETVIEKDEIRMSKEEILRNSSLISSVNKDEKTEIQNHAPQKCSCQIM